MHSVVVAAASGGVIGVISMVLCENEHSMVILRYTSTPLNAVA